MTRTLHPKAPPPVRLSDPSIPDAVDELIGRCVDPAPGRRYQKTEEVAADLEAIAAWLQQCGVTTVAMESTGVYWVPLYELLETRGFQVLIHALLAQRDELQRDRNRP